MKFVMFLAEINVGIHNLNLKNEVNTSKLTIKIFMMKK